MSKEENETFQDGDLTFEKITITLPQPIVNFYRFLTIAQDKDVSCAAGLIAQDIIAEVNAKIEGNSKEDWAESFNLKASIDRFIKK